MDTSLPRRRGPKPGSHHRPSAVAAEKLMVAYAEPIARRVIDQAMAGDIAAARLCLDMALLPRAPAEQPKQGDPNE